MLQTTVVVIGGGATGMGILRDLSLRGVPAILLEQGGLAHGTSSRFHGLLHSGGRYAVGDNESARECIEENTILRRVGRSFVEDTEGFFVLTPKDDPAYVDGWVSACHKAGIDTQELGVAEARRLEPELAPDIRRVFRVPDASVDGFRLVVHNMMSARRHGGRTLTYHEVTAIRQQNGKISGVTARNTINGEEVRIDCQCVVNAAGSWAGKIAGLAGLDVCVSPDRGTLVAFNHRFTSRVVNRLHPGSDGDIFVPHGSITILGTTSTATDRPDDTRATTTDILRLLDIGEPLFPAIRQYRILRAFAGTRPLYTPGGAHGRKASRNFHVVDHADDGLQGMFSIFGGKLTTYRLMAERVCDQVCRQLGVTSPCRTAIEDVTPQPDERLLATARRHFPVNGLDLMANRLGDDLPLVLDEARKRVHGSPNLGNDANPLICECEMVSLAEIACVARDEASHNLTDVRLRTRLGMGTCQGTFCSVRSLGAMMENGISLHTSPTQSAKDFLQERWNGLRPALWGMQAREMELGRAVYAGIFNLDGAMHEQQD